MLAVYIGENREVRCNALLDANTNRYWMARFHRWVNLELSATLLCDQYDEITITECWKRAVEPLLKEVEIPQLYCEIGWEITVISYDGQIPESTRKLLRCVVVKFLNLASWAGMNINIHSITAASQREWDSAEQRWLTYIGSFLSVDDSTVHEILPRTYGPPVLRK